jgi:hypothetical protein
LSDPGAADPLCCAQTTQPAADATSAQPGRLSNTLCVVVETDMNQAADELTATRIVSRVAACVVGGWAFTWGFVSVVITGLVALGQPYHEASTAAMLLAFIVFLVALCWAIATASLARVWAVLAGGAALMTGAAWLLQRSLI